MFLVELELILTELQPFEHSHFRQLFALSGMGLCNQLLLQFSTDHFETMYTCCGYIEDVHMNFCRRKQAINLKLCTDVISILKMCI